MIYVQWLLTDYIYPSVFLWSQGSWCPAWTKQRGAHTHLLCSKDSQHTYTRTKQQHLMHHVLRCPHKMVSQLTKLQTTMLKTLVFIITPSMTFSDINCIYTHSQNLAVCADEVFFFFAFCFYCKNDFFFFFFFLVGQKTPLPIIKSTSHESTKMLKWHVKKKN